MQIHCPELNYNSHSISLVFSKLVAKKRNKFKACYCSFPGGFQNFVLENYFAVASSSL